MSFWISLLICYPTVYYELNSDARNGNLGRLPFGDMLFADRNKSTSFYLHDCWKMWSDLHFQSISGLKAKDHIPIFHT